MDFRNGIAATTEPFPLEQGILGEFLSQVLVQSSSLAVVFALLSLWSVPHMLLFLLSASIFLTGASSMASASALHCTVLHFAVLSALLCTTLHDNALH